MTSLYRRTWQMFAETTTIHGIPDLVLAKTKLTRFLWASVMVASVSLLGYQLFTAIRLYHEGPTYFQTSVIQLDRFPQIQILTQNFINNTKAGLHGLRQDHICFLMGYFKDWPHMKMELDAFKMGLNKSYLDSLKQHIDEVRKRLDIPNVIDLIHFLSFDATEIVDASTHAPDTANPNISRFADAFGISYIAHTFKQLSDSSQIPYFASQVGIWKFFISNLTSMHAACTHFALEEFGGYILAIDEDIFEYNKWISVKPNSYHQLLITPDFKRLINRPGSPCEVNGISLARCHQHCRRNIAFSDLPWRCPGNGMVFFDGHNSDSGRLYNAIYGAIGMGNCTEPELRQMNLCMSSCTEPCEIRSYMLNMKELYFNLSNALNDAGKRNFFSVRMATRWQAHVVEEAYVYSLTGLFSNIGGLLGLFTGASVISILQLMIFSICGTWLQNRSPTESQNVMLSA